LNVKIHPVVDLRSYSQQNPPPVQPAARRQAVGAIQGCISEVLEEPNPEPPEPSDPGDGDDDGKTDPESGTNSKADDPIPNPNLNAEGNGKEQVGHRMLAALERLADHSAGDGTERQDSRAKLQEPNQFNGSCYKREQNTALHSLRRHHRPPSTSHS
jgi:hypothetical protein